MKLSCCVWALSGDDEAVISSLADLGFKYLDVRPSDFESDATKILLREKGLGVSCVGTSFGLGENAKMDAVAQADADRSLDHLCRALDHGHVLGAGVAYVVPEVDGKRDALDRYARVLTAAADRAESLGMKLCVEHFPGKALPTAKGTLEYVRALDHPNLYLLLDTGHLQITGEDPSDTIENAGPLLGYVHLDDNDGIGDLHLALLDGVLDRRTLARTLRTLEDTGYDGPVSLELNPALPDPLDALRRSRETVLQSSGS
jgi:sugar phosphate isomerase/epimerase